MSILVTIHSIWRWVLLVAAVAAIVKAFVGWLGRRPYTPLDRRLGMLYTMVIDIQVLIGLILWIGERRFSVFAGGMGDPTLRFYGLEHPLIMLAALALAHVGYSRSRKGSGDVPQHRTAALFYLASLILILAAIPWDRLVR
jgi:hypothetical protein